MSPQPRRRLCDDEDPYIFLVVNDTKAAPSDVFRRVVRYRANVEGRGHLGHLDAVFGIFVDVGHLVGALLGEIAAYDVPGALQHLFAGAAGQVVLHQVGEFSAVVGGIHNHVDDRPYRLTFGGRTQLLEEICKNAGQPRNNRFLYIMAGGWWGGLVV